MKTRMHIHMTLPHTPRGRHILEALLVGGLVVAAALGLAYALSQRAAPAPSAVVSSQPRLERFYDFKRRQVEQREWLPARARATGLARAQARFEDFKRRQVEQREWVPARARATGLAIAQARFHDFKLRQVEARGR